MLLYKIVYSTTIRAPLQYKDHLSRYEDFHYKDKMAMRLSHDHNEKPYTGKTTSLHIDIAPTKGDNTVSMVNWLDKPHSSPYAQALRYQFIYCEYLGGNWPFYNALTLYHLYMLLNCLSCMRRLDSLGPGRCFFFKLILQINILSTSCEIGFR